MTEAVESFFGWIKERHNIYLSRAAGNPAPWTSDFVYISKFVCEGARLGSKPILSRTDRGLGRRVRGRIQY